MSESLKLKRFVKQTTLRKFQEKVVNLKVCSRTCLLQMKYARIRALIQRHVCSWTRWHDGLLWYTANKKLYKPKIFSRETYSQGWWYTGQLWVMLPSTLETRSKIEMCYPFSMGKLPSKTAQNVGLCIIIHSHNNQRIHPPLQLKLSFCPRKAQHVVCGLKLMRVCDDIKTVAEITLISDSTASIHLSVSTSKSDWGGT